MVGDTDYTWFLPSTAIAFVQSDSTSAPLATADNKMGDEELGDVNLFPYGDNKTLKRRVPG